VILYGLVSAMSPRETIALCVGSLDTRRHNALNLLTGLRQISTAFPCRLSPCVGYVQLFLLHRRIRTLAFLRWALLIPFWMLNRVQPMELSRLSNSFPSISLIQLSTWPYSSQAMQLTSATGSLAMLSSPTVDFHDG
jgi:hypothetical protein